MDTLKKRKTRKFFWIFLPLAATSLLWTWAKVDIRYPISLGRAYLLLSQITALWGLILLSQSYIVVARIKQIEYLFGGLDKAFKLHKSISQAAFILILTHPILLLLDSLYDSSLILSLLIPFSEYGSIAKTAGILSLYTYIVLILITIFKVLPYHIWKWTHNLMGIPFFFAAYHGLVAESDVKYFEVLKIWIIFWLILGVAAYVYKGFLYYHIGPKFKYKIKSVNEKKGVHELILDNLGRRLNFEPGEFVYISFPNHRQIPAEHHPFTISSCPDDDNIRISYKVYGDYTQKLTSAKPGDIVNVFGPFGEFSSYVFSPYKKQIWIAGGIGITPFLSMLNYEVHNKDKKEIRFYFSSKTKEECIYLDEVENEIAVADDNIKFICNHSDSMGFLTADSIVKDIPNIGEYLILLCGPEAMMNSLKRDFIKLGVRESMIVYEEFNIL